MVYFQCFTISDILPLLICNDNGSVSIAYSSLFSIFVYYMFQNKGHANIVVNKGVFIFSMLYTY
jgi:hypothetical protein